MAEGWRKLRVGYRCGRALASLVLVLMLSVPWRLAGRWRSSRRAIENAAWDILLRGFGIRVRCHGDRRLAPGTLVLADHLSWVDIAVLARVADVGFVAKADVAGWPLLGVLAQRHGSVFVDRHRRAGVVEAGRELVVRLASGRSLVLLPRYDQYGRRRGRSMPAWFRMSRRIVA
jgi:1-acyl-sn-glycerol-3-phosphate acyltransferase